MFFGYPIAATAENWLHECLCEMVLTVHASVEAGKDVLAWPAIIPAAYRARLRSRRGLRDRLQVYGEAAAGLTAEQLLQVEVCLIQQNDIADLLSCMGNCEIIADLPEAIREPAEDLFTFAFELLDDLGVRDAQYERIYTVIDPAVCPFCGSEYFDHPQSHREDLDHYLAKTIYPFAAANLRNLSPMGKKCNGYKLQQDMLRDVAGDRRRSFDPYGEHQLAVSLINSVPFGGTEDQIPRWQIDFLPDSPECATWDAVFSFRERIERDTLDKYFGSWLGQFAAWFRLRKGLADVGDARILESVREYKEDLEIQGFEARLFLRFRVFEMLEAHCKQGHERLIELLRDFIMNAVT
jgi:hypothetical protein